MPAEGAGQADTTATGPAILVLDSGRNAAPGGDGNAVLLGPQADRPRIALDAGARNVAASANRRPAAHRAGSLPESIKRLGQDGEVLFSQVDFAPFALPTNPHGLRVVAAVQVVGDAFDYFSGHWHALPARRICRRKSTG